MKANLTREEKIELLHALEAKEKLNKKKRNKFIPHAGQAKILNSPAKIKICTQGNSFGKSALGVNLLHARCTGVEPWSGKHTKVPIKAVVLLDNPSKISEVWRSEYAKWHDIDAVSENKQGTPHVREWHFKNGSTVRFLTGDQDQLVFESIQFDLLIIDEPCKRSQFIGLMRGQRAKNVQAEAIMIGTPVSNDHAWIRQDLIEPWLEGKRPDTECFTGSSFDNAANLDSEFLTRFEGLLTDKEKRVRLFGEFVSVDGLAFGHLLQDSLHLINQKSIYWDMSWPVVIGIDPHPSKAHVAVMVGRRPGDDKLIALKEISRKLTAREFAHELLTWAIGYKVVDWVCDSLGSADSTGHEGFKSFIAVLNECGIKARATTFEDKSHEDAVERIRAMLALEDSGPPLFERSPRLRFVEEAVQKTYTELKNIAWVYDKKREVNKPKLDSGKLDYYSALTYALSSSYLAKITVNRGQSETKTIKHSAGAGKSLAQGLGITTSNTKSSIYKKPMKRFYTRNYLMKDEDD